MSESIDDKIDELESYMMDYPPVNCPLDHIFTPGLYTRTIFMPAGSLITSLIHKTEHQFIISAGIVLVKIREGEWQRLAAPYIGVTKPGTRRILYIEVDCLWTTCHATDIQPKDESEEAIAEAVALIEANIIEPHENKLLGGIIKNNIISQSIYIK
jgi:hypothetical protein